MGGAGKGSVYDLRSVDIARAEGVGLRLMVAMLEWGPTRALLEPALLGNAGIRAFRRGQSEGGTARPARRPPRSPGKGLESAEERDARIRKANASGPFGSLGPEAVESLSRRVPRGPLPRVADYLTAYRVGSSSPFETAARLVDYLQGRDAELRYFSAWDRADIMAQAEASAERWRRGRPLGPLDGVPVAVKDELDMRGFGTSVGTSFLGASPAAEDARAVERLRAAGALLCGKTVMHEIGIGVTGQNPAQGSPRNPWDTRRHSGGSSSGSAAAAGAGLCPIALGADGGGSIRIPASFCGAVGLKPSWGRVSERGAAPLCWSVAHVGPISANAVDAALAYALMAGPDPADPASLGQPEPELPRLDPGFLKGKRVAVDPAWFDHCQAEVRAVCRAALEAMAKAGAEPVEVSIAGLEEARVAHLIIIVSEMAQAMQLYYPSRRRELALETRANLALARCIGAPDYVGALRARARACREFERVLDGADFIATPAAGILPPLMPPSAQGAGSWDVGMLTEIMRFSTPANLTGLPAISFPAGYSQEGLPVGLQLIGPWWSEAALLDAANAYERLVARKAPAVMLSPLRPAD